MKQPTASPDAIPEEARLIFALSGVITGIFVHTRILNILQKAKATGYEGSISKVDAADRVAAFSRVEADVGSPLWNR
jgi:hypothetical protein